MQNFLAQFDLNSIRLLVIQVLAVLLCIVVHEVCHGVAAYCLGDPTAKEQKRLSPNPLRHIDPFGALMMLVVGFGWAKPVPVDMRHFKNPKIGMAITAFAGPLSNFILAFLLGFLTHASLGAFYASGSEVLYFFAEFFYSSMYLSIGLGIFNLIPFPPLDGSKILAMFLPDRFHMTLMQYERYGMLILMAVLWFGLLDMPLYAARNWMFDLFYDNTIFFREIIYSMLR